MAGKGIEAIRFTGKKFCHKNDYDLIDILTDNMIVICDSPQTKNMLFDEFQKICSGKCEEKDDHSYYYDSEYGKYPEITKIVAHYLPVTRFIIDGEQTITLSIEASVVPTAKNINNIWFAMKDGDGLLCIYPMRIFKGSTEKWNEGIGVVYNYICQGRYGAYDGYWMDKESLSDNFTYGTLNAHEFSLNPERVRQ